MEGEKGHRLGARSQRIAAGGKEQGEKPYPEKARALRGGAVARVREEGLEKSPVAYLSHEGFT